MMRRTFAAALLMAILVCIPSFAGAYIIRLHGSSPGVLSNASVTGMITDEHDGYALLNAPVVPEASSALYRDNDTSSIYLCHSLMMSSAPDAWYGMVVGRGGYTGQIEVRFFSVTFAPKVPSGTWYVYKGHAQTARIGGKLVVTNSDQVSLLDSGVFSSSVITWTDSTFTTGALDSGDHWTLTQAELVPEPASIAVFICGLAGIGIRRKYF